MVNITITLPKHNLWGVTFGGGSFKRDSASKILNFVERKLLKTRRKSVSSASQECPKTCVKIKDDHSIVNETLDSVNPNYLVYATTCLLEDYLSVDVLHDAEKRWLKYLKNGGAEW